MGIRIFTEEYKTIGTALKGSFPGQHKPLIDSLKRLVADDGPECSAAGSLDKLREQCVDAKGKKSDSKGILALAGTEPQCDKRAAALKALRHLYLMTRKGGHTAWVMALPNAYTKWPSEEIGGKSGKALEDVLDKGDERFGNKQMRDLAACTQQTVAWANKAAAIATATKGVGAETAKTLAARWFGDEDTDDEDIKKILAKLSAGYKKIAAAAGGHKLVMTDNPFHRGSTYEKANAYVWYDKLQVVYIEEGFFGKGGDPLTGLDNWTRIMVHELSHLVLKTDDHRYRHKGIKPKAKGSFTAKHAIENADSWAFFAADANGAMTEKDRKYCLK